MNKNQIIIFPLGQFNSYCLQNIIAAVTHEFKCSVTIKTVEFDLEEYYDKVRRQYDGNLLLKSINELEKDLSIIKMGLFEVDLFIPILTFIFGQAIYNGNAGVVSMYRLKNEQYGLKTDHNLSYARLKKVVIHELGHSFGLKHCYVPNCVMRSSTYVEDIDQKTPHFCKKCQAELKYSTESTSH